MSKLRNHYVNELRHNQDNLERSPWYLSELVTASTLEIDARKRAEDQGLEHTHEYAHILQKYHPQECLDTFNSPYTAVLFALNETLGHQIRNIDELQMRARLLQKELQRPQPNERTDDLLHFLCNLAGHYKTDHVRRHIVTGRRSLA